MRFLGLEIRSGAFFDRVVDNAKRLATNNAFQRSLGGIGTIDSSFLGHGGFTYGFWNKQGKVQPHNPYGPLGEGVLAHHVELRQYSRSLLRAHEYGGWAKRVIDDVITHDPRMPTFSSKVPVDVAERVGEAWLNWWTANTGAGVDGRGMDGPTQERSALWSLIEDGDAFAIPYMENKNLCIEARNGGDLYDVQIVTELSNGKRSYLGVELDDRLRTTAYYFRRRELSLSVVGLSGNTGKVRRVPARNVFHVFDRMATDMFRGLPWIVPALIQAMQLKEVELSFNNILAMLAKIPFTMKHGENSLGAYGGLTGGGEESIGADSSLILPGVDNKGANDPKEVKIGGNTVLQLQPGAELTWPAGNLPMSNAKDYLSRIQKSVSAAMMMSYARLSGDNASTNFSALRAGEIDDMSHHREVHNLWVKSWRRPIFRRWLLWATARGDIIMPSSVEVQNALMNPTWAVVRRPWVDPQKEAGRLKTLMDLGVISCAEARAEMGYPPDKDLEGMWDEKQKKALEMMGQNQQPGVIQDAKPKPKQKPKSKKDDKPKSSGEKKNDK